MKRLIFFMLVIIIALFYGISLGSEQESSDREYRHFERFGRGIVNVITSPLELPVQMYVRAKYWDERSNNPFAVVGGYVEGVPMGLLYFAWRLGAGFYDITTFPFSRFDKNVINPEYLSTSTKYLDKKE